MIKQAILLYVFYEIIRFYLMERERNGLSCFYIKH